MPDPDIPSPIVTLVPRSLWTDLEEGPAQVLQDIINITGTGSSQLPASDDTFTNVYVNAAGAVTLLLPIAADLVAGQRWTVIDKSGAADSNPITVNGNGSLISGQSTFILNYPYGSVILEWNGAAFSLVV